MLVFAIANVETDQDAFGIGKIANDLTDRLWYFSYQSWYCKYLIAFC